MATIIKVVNTITALGADAVLSNGLLTFKGLTIPVETATVRKVPYQAQVLRSERWTATAASSTTFGFVITGNSTIDGSNKQWIVPDFTSDTNATITEISTVITNAINGFAGCPVSSALGGSGDNKYFTLTATSPFVTYTAAKSTSSAGVITQSNVTAGVVGNGLGSIIIAAGKFVDAAAIAALTTTGTYATYYIRFSTSTPINETTTNSGNFMDLVLYVLESATNYASLSGTYGTLTQGLAGVTATHITATGTMAVTQTTGALELASSGTFSVDAAILPGDIAYPATLVYYPVSSILDANSGLTSNTAPASLAAAAFTWVTLRNGN